MRQRHLRHSIRQVDVKSRAQHLNGQAFCLHDKGTGFVRHDIEKSFTLQHRHIATAIREIR
ncbi:hypothetical protein D3C72_1445670 [compost metagenome]